MCSSFVYHKTWTHLQCEYSNNCCFPQWWNAKNLHKSLSHFQVDSSVCWFLEDIVEQNLCTHFIALIICQCFNSPITIIFMQQQMLRTFGQWNYYQNTQQWRQHCKSQQELPKLMSSFKSINILWKCLQVLSEQDIHAQTHSDHWDK